MENAKYQNRKAFFSFFLTRKGCALILSDTCAIFLALLCTYILRLLLGSTLAVQTYISIIPFILIFPFLYALFELYPSNFWHPAEELKRLSLATTWGFLLFTAIFFFTKSSEHFSRAFFLTAWIFALFAIPLARYFTKRKFNAQWWWRIPVIVIGSHASAEYLSKTLHKEPGLDLSLVASLWTDCPQDPTGTALPLGKDNHPCLNEENIHERFAALEKLYPSALVILHLPSIDQRSQEAFLKILGEYFHRIIMLPELSWEYCIPSQILNLRGTFALSVRRNLADKRRVRLKRCIDLTAACGIAFFCAPLFLLLALLIKQDSKGPVFFHQKRIGKNGKEMRIFKFRTMQSNAEAVLAQYLEQNPDMAQEWRDTQKLRNDPRITRIGHFLRRTSLDELPQVFNVIRGEMSLVGPRPIVQSEMEKYGDVFSFYCAVPPGITGLWQVSGRSDTSYEYRVKLDRYYIANWSVWLDIYVLIKTFPAVLGSKGAY